MKLLYTPPSPFFRKVMAMAIETGLDARIELVEVHPFEREQALAAENPLGRVPTLVTDDGLTLFESDVVCAYLDTLHDGSPMIPMEPERRWPVLRVQAIADGILDASVQRRYESLRPAALQWSDWSDRQKRKVMRGLDALENDAASREGPLDLGKIAVGCVLGYLDFRFPDDRWRDGRPELAAWFATFDERPSMRKTRPA
ncbi:MAG: glutathione S-transferase [Rhodospirillaceae bacterium]|nr:glutathione S-transferase [Rhodospirillaceae bacterium]|tara:strand:+ start:989 stop:1588 length:600 start_codon:yes stop_codon:yes gene_type:complete